MEQTFFTEYYIAQAHPCCRGLLYPICFTRHMMLPHDNPGFSHSPSCWCSGVRVLLWASAAEDITAQAPTGPPLPSPSTTLPLTHHMPAGWPLVYTLSSSLPQGLCTCLFHFLECFCQSGSCLSFWCQDNVTFQMPALDLESSPPRNCPHGPEILGSSGKDGWSTGAQGWGKRWAREAVREQMQEGLECRGNEAVHVFVVHSVLGSGPLERSLVQPGSSSDL